MRKTLPERVVEAFWQKVIYYLVILFCLIYVALFEFDNECPRLSRVLMVYRDLHRGKLCFVSPMTSNCCPYFGIGYRENEK